MGLRPINWSGWDPFLFWRQGFRLRRRFTVWTTDTQRIHTIFQHSPADAELGGRVSLHIIILFQRVQDDFTLELHDGFFQRQASRQGIVPKRGGSCVITENSR